MRRTVLLLAVLVGPSVGCAVDSRTPNETILRDSAGVQIASTPATASPQLPWTLDVEPTLVLGLEGGEITFGAVGSVLVLGSGRIAVADPISREIHVFDDTSPVRVVGRPGEGPGEFSNLTWIGESVGDTLLAFDNRRSSVSVFAPSGAFVRSFVIRREPDAGPPSVVGALGDGRLVVSARATAQDGADTSLVAVSVIDQAGARVGGLGHFPDMPLGSNGLGMGYGSTAILAVGDSSVWVGHQSRFALKSMGADGELRQIIRREVDSPREVTADEIADARASVEESLQRQGASGPAVDRILQTEYAVTHPILGRMIVSKSGHLWVSKHIETRFDRDLIATAAETWDVFESDGRYVGAVTLSPGFAAREVGTDYVLGVATDDLGVQSVRSYRLGRVQ